MQLRTSERIIEQMKTSSSHRAGRTRTRRGSIKYDSPEAGALRSGDALGSAAGSKHASHTAALLPCEAWDEGQVLRWLREDVSLPQLEPAFAQWRVDGPLLLELDTTDLEEMGVDSRLQRKRVMNKIDQLRALSMAKALATPNHKPRRVCERRPDFLV